MLKTSFSIPTLLADVGMNRPEYTSANAKDTYIVTRDIHRSVKIDAVVTVGRWQKWNKHKKLMGLKNNFHAFGFRPFLNKTAVRGTTLV